MVFCNFPCSLKQQHRITMTNEMWNILLCNFEGCSGILSQPFLIAHDRQTLHAPTRTNKRDYKMTQWCSNKHFHTTTVLYCCMATIPEHHPRGWLLHRPTESPPSLILRPQHPLSDLPIVSEVENYWLHGLWSCPSWDSSREGHLTRKHISQLKYSFRLHWRSILIMSVGTWHACKPLGHLAVRQDM